MNVLEYNLISFCLVILYVLSSLCTKLEGNYCDLQYNYYCQMICILSCLVNILLTLD